MAGIHKIGSLVMGGAHEDFPSFPSLLMSIKLVLALQAQVSEGVNAFCMGGRTLEGKDIRIMQWVFG